MLETRLEKRVLQSRNGLNRTENFHVDIYFYLHECVIASLGFLFGFSVSLTDHYNRNYDFMLLKL